MKHLSLGQLAAYINRSRSTTARRIQRGLLPAANQQVGNALLFDADEVDAAFAALRPDTACVVPTDAELGMRELRKYSVYACPTETGHHIGIERPSILGLYKSSAVVFYDVVDVEILGYGPQGTRTPGKVSRKVQAHRLVDDLSSENLAVFFLGAEIGRLAIVPIQKGRVVPAQWVRDNLDSPGTKPVKLPQLA